MEFKAIGWNMVGISEFLSHSDPFGYIWIGAQLASELETGVSIYVCLICYGRLGLLKGDITHCQTSFAFHS
jgi:hypothetical protein